MDRATASIREFARIVGVDHAAVSRAIKGGERLRKSVVSEDGKTRIVIYEGCLEWHQNKNFKKDRSREGSGVNIPGIMPKEISTDIDSHYSALIKQVEHGKITGQLMPAAKFQQEAAECFRACRDTLLNLPLSVSEVAKAIILRMFRDKGEEFVLSMEKPLEGAALQIRLAAKQEIRKSLLHAIKIVQDDGEEKKKTEESLNAI